MIIEPRDTCYITYVSCGCVAASPHLLNLSRSITLTHFVVIILTCIFPVFPNCLIVLSQACVLAGQCLLQAGKQEDCSVLLEEVMGPEEEALEAAKSTALYISPPSGSGRYEYQHTPFGFIEVPSLSLLRF